MKTLRTFAAIKAVSAGLLALALCAPAMAATPWQKITHPVAGTPEAIGSYANGCQVGAQPLPLNSPAYQVMRTDQRRYFGQPDLLAFITRLGTQAQQKGLGTMLVGDMAMPAGGRFSSGHASHQSGLDVDIWLQLPYPLPPAARPGPACRTCRHRCDTPHSPWPYRLRQRVRRAT